MNPKNDGVNHINVYSRGKTELGRFLSNFARTPFECADGRFQSVEGYWYWLSSPDDRLRKLWGFAAKKAGREARKELGVKKRSDFEDRIKAAIKAKLVADPGKRAEFLSCKLPFQHYYVFGGRAKNADSTFLRLLNEVREEIRREKPIRRKKTIGAVRLSLGNCVEILPTFRENHFHAIVTDPPYHLTQISRRGSPRKNDPKTPFGRHRLQSTGFMQMRWDGGDVSFRPETWRECLRVLRPGGHLLAMGGSRTFHRLACAIEDAGFELRDTLMWLFASGMPKSLNVSRYLSAMESKKWFDIAKALDNVDQPAILAAWKEHSKTASDAGLSFVKRESVAGTSTRKRGFVPALVLLQANRENSDAVALIAKLSSTEARRIDVASCNSVPSNADAYTTVLRDLAISAAKLPASRVATLAVRGSSALENVRGWQDESTTDRIMAGEALKIWLGSKPSSKKEDTAALCAALTSDLKHIILSRSKTYRNADTTRQMAYVSAISATITESTAASLISFTVATLKSKAIDKTTAPATSDAKKWEGWGTSLKPGFEAVILARKPLSEKNVAANVLRWGTGALNIGACRVGSDLVKINRWADGAKPFGGGAGHPYVGVESKGRFPANVLHDGSDEILDVFAHFGLRKSSRCEKPSQPEIKGREWGTIQKNRGPRGYDDSGSAARFFFCAKASRKERPFYCRICRDVFPASKIKDHAHGKPKGRNDHICSHATVKPLALMRYLVRLVTPANGRILDPFMGSGTTGVAALDEGFRFSGIEIDEHNFDICLRRCTERKVDK